MKKVISLAVFNHKKHAYRPGYYWQHLKHTVWGYLCLFPDYELWIYHDESLYNNYYGGVILRLASAGLIKLKFMGTNPDICKAMLWRLEPLFDSDVDFLFCRDTDHTPTHREHKMNEQFISSGKVLHCVQDNPAHSCPMLGGLVGFKTKDTKSRLRCDSVSELIRLHSYEDKLNEHGTDQEFLNKHVWPILKRHSAFHSVRPENHGSHKLPYVEPTTLIDKCTPFMGTPKCDFDTWYRELRKLPCKDIIDALDCAEKNSYTAQNFSHLNLENACVNKKRVVLAVDASITYFFFMGIVTMLWQKYMGFCPVILIADDISNWLNDPVKKYALNFSRSYGAEIYFIDKIDNFKSSTVAQNARMYALCLPMYHDEMYLMTSDMDMLPLSKEFFNKQDMSYDVHLDYANASDGSHYPLCYVGAKVKTWREIMQPSNPNSIEESLKSIFYQSGLDKQEDGMRLWCFDEEMFGRKIKAWSGYPSKCQKFDRRGGPPVDRIDKSCWPKTVKVKGMSDCHSVRPGYTSPNWEKIESVLIKILDEQDLKTIRDYRWQFCTLVNEGK